MKKVIFFIMAIALVVICLPMGTVTHAASQEVTLSAGGSLADALTEVADGGTIKVEGTVAVTAAPGTHGKTVTITGGNLDFSGLSGNLSLGDHITFENITLTFAADRSPAQAIYANGYKVKIGEGVTMPNAIRIFGGKSGGTTPSTNLTVLSGYYTQIFGGGNNTDIIGDVNLYVGGNVNKDIDAFSHSKGSCVYGGSYIPEGSSKTIGGTVRTVFTDSAKANYIFGGNLGAGTGTISGGVELTVSGGSVMSVYGSNQGGSFSGDVKLLISGGTMEQVFGGSEGGGVTGDVAVDITGGSITRRVYGGCYNEVSGLGSWSSSYYVTGEIVLTLHNGANINYSYSGNDKAVYAHSRQKTLSGTEVSHLVFADSTAYNNYKSKVKAQDFAMQIIMGSTSAADYIHYHTYSASGAVITQNCIDKNCSASATVVVEGTPAYVGTPVEPAKVIYSGNWFGGDLNIAYANNEGPGTGTASITYGGAAASVDFAITLPNLYMNGAGYGSLEDAIEAARQTPGADAITLTQDIEVATWVVINTDVTITADKAVTIAAADSQTGSMIRVIGGGKLTIAGASEDAKITFAAGVNTANVIVNNGGEINLINVRLQGNKNTTYTRNNKACGIFNDEGTVTAKSVDVVDMVMGDGIYALAGTTVNLDNVTVSGCGRYGIKVTGTVNVYNTVHSDHALSVSNTGDNAIDIENGGKISSNFTDIPADAYAIRIFDIAKKDINVRGGGSEDLSHISTTDTEPNI